MATVDPHGESDADDLSIHSLTILDSQPYDWKDGAREKLLYIFQAAAQRSAPNVDLGPLTPAIREVISKALEGVEERVVRYAEHVTQPARRKRGVEEVKILQDMETSLKFYFEEKLRAASQEDTEEFPPAEAEDAHEQDEADLHVRALTRCHSLMMEDLLAKETPLIDRMIEAGLVSAAGGEAIRKKRTELERNREVLRLAEGLTVQQFTQSFLPALRDGNELLAAKLASTMEELRETARSDIERGCRVCGLRGRVDLRRLADPLLEKRLIPRDFHGDLCKETLSSAEAWKQVFLHVGHTQRLVPILRQTFPGVVEEMERRDLSSLECRCLMPRGLVAPQGPPDLSEDRSDIGRMSDVASTFDFRNASMAEYPLTSTQMGICLVVENSSYDKALAVAKPSRSYEGTTRLIQKEFQSLGFQIVKHSNLSAQELMQEARRIAALDHSQHDCFACVVRSRHEGSDKILCSDRATVPVQDLMNIFNPSRCSSLAGKPKIFYVPMNRGREFQTCTFLPGEAESEVHPDGADFLLIQTALPRFAHGSDSTTGVPLHLRYLAGALQERGPNQDFMTCLAAANRGYCQETSRSEGFTAAVTSTLRKSLVFRKLPREEDVTAERS